jgi:prepilin-type N-terminal cleavage/methylation domain-containing protein
MRGFSLLEMLLSLSIMLVVTGAMFALIDPANATFASQPELADMQQRLRLAVDGLGRDLRMAGAGSRGYFASIVPYRRGFESADPPGAFFDDRVSVLYVPASAAETSVDTPTDGGSAVLVRPQAGCPIVDPLCGFHAKMIVAIFDESGAYDIVRLSGVAADPPMLLYVGFTLSKSYAADARVAQVETATYWQRTNTSGNVPQLMKYDGVATDLPLADNVTELRFEYFADADVGQTSPSVVSLGSDRLTDGPWLPDPTAPNRWDVDILHIRRVRISMRVRANGAFLRPPISDQEIQFDVAPRNLNLAK